MPRIRTIHAAFLELQAMDANTSLSQNYVRDLVCTGQISSRKAGRKYLIDFDDLLRFLGCEHDLEVHHER